MNSRLRCKSSCSDCGDLRALLRALKSQLALVVALVQVADAGLYERSLKGCPDAVMRRDLRSIRQ